MPEPSRCGAADSSTMDPRLITPLPYDGLSAMQLVELKNGETYNGHMVNCDTWMNIHLREVICTSKVGGCMLLQDMYLPLKAHGPFDSQHS